MNILNPIHYVHTHISPHVLLFKSSNPNIFTKSVRIQEVLGQCSQALGGVLGVSFVGPRAGLDDLCGSLTIQHVL